MSGCALNSNNISPSLALFRGRRWREAPDEGREAKRSGVAASTQTHLQQFMLMFRCKPLILLVWISSVLKM